MYVVLENAGSDKEQIVYTARTMDCCYDYVDSHYAQDEIESLSVDCLRVNADGSLSTDF